MVVRINFIVKNGGNMSYFNRFYKKEKLVNRSFQIDENLYFKLEYLSKNVYDASISKLVNASIEQMINNENICIYGKKNKSCISRSFLIRESLLNGLYNLKEKYGLSICMLVNMSIRNAIIEEENENKAKIMKIKMFR